MIEDFLGEKHLLAKNSPTPTGEALLSLFPNTTEFAGDVASLANVDEPDSPACILRGKIVTMNDGSEIIENGKIYIEKGFIIAVTAADEPRPV